jgi:3,4-dihydroxy 2-butanone 4-phosphate synthase/GTP cyclohydrolase II
METPFSPIPEILDELRAGRMIVLVDDENRENEGDLVQAAEKSTPGAVNFMRQQTGGVICLAMTNVRAEQLGLPLMVLENTSARGTPYTVSVDARAGITTGISSADRARTILTAAHDQCRPEDLVRPGHIFPLRARDGGVLVRSGHTEGAVDLCRLAGLKPMGVVSEIMNDDGTMARLPELTSFCARHGLKMTSIADLIAWRRRQEKLIERMEKVRLPTEFGTFTLHCYKSLVDEYLHLALCAGGVGDEADGKTVVHEEPVLVRVHSECLTGDIFESKRCDCGGQLRGSLAAIAKSKGVLLYIRQEGRGIGLINKLRAYALQEKGDDTVEANERMGLPADLREYGIGAQILLDLGVRRMRLMTNNPKKIVSIGGYGLEVVDRVPIEMPATRENADYLRTKRDKLGHLFGRLDDSAGGP